MSNFREKDLDLTDCRVAVVGLGLMGGSLAMALKGKCAVIYGVDRNPEVIAQAMQRQIIEQGACDPAEILPQADVIVLAAPVLAILEYLHELPKLHPGSALVIDLGSTKRQVMSAMAQLPLRFQAVGGHPMCGKEVGGIQNASPDLYINAAFALCALAKTSEHSQGLAEQLVQALGARPIWLDPAVHDAWSAATSHLPYLLACALAQCTPLEARPLVGPGYRSTSRVAATPSSVMLDILSTNQDAVLEALGRFRQAIDHLEDLVHNQDWDGLQRTLDRAVKQQKRLTGAST